MENFITKARLVLQDKGLRGRIIFTVAALIAFRALAAIPIPGINTLQLNALFANNQLFGLFNVFSGGGLSNLSIVMLGVGPYITGSIIMQLLTLMSPRLKAMYQEEGEAGKMRFALYSRWITLPLALLQSFGFLVLLQRSGIVAGSIGTFDFIRNMLVISAGSILLVWIGELISEFGLGNGISLLIFAGIIARLPSTIGQIYASTVTFDPTLVLTYVGLLAAVFVLIWAVVLITEAERPIPVTYAKRVRGMKVYGGTSTYLPLRLNQAGVIPIIFALSILLFPPMVLNFVLSLTHNAIVVSISNIIITALSPTGVIYAVLYFLFVFLFTYFYTAVTFDPDQIATNLQKNGAFIPGVRPGKPTAEYVTKILTRLTLFGALFLGIIAVLPLIVRALTGLTYLTVGGTALLIVVSVVLDLMKKIDAQVSLREY